MGKKFKKNNLELYKKIDNDIKKKSIEKDVRGVKNKIKNIEISI